MRENLSKLRLNELAVGADGRNRCLLSAFASGTGRNQPSNAKFIFGPSVWLRGLIKPAPGMALAYVDYEQQEFGVGAALSGDPAMMHAYLSGNDPYLEFAKQAGAVPPDACKEAYREDRERFKQCVLGTQYGMGPETLTSRIGQTPAHARELLRLHRETYRRFWQWSDAALDHMMLHGYLRTRFGWAERPGTNPNPRSLRNFPMQANSAEILRLACMMGIEAGIKICAPVHDAVLIEAPAAGIEDHAQTMQRIMTEASAKVLGGFRLRSDKKIVRYPDRYIGPARHGYVGNGNGITKPAESGESCGMKDSDNIDIESLRIRDGDIPVTRIETLISRQRRERREHRFIKVPLVWKDRLLKAKWRATVLVALHLLELEWRGTEGAPVVLSNLGLEELEISRRQKWRALRELETLKLVTVERIKGKSPRVTLHKIVTHSTA